jgi:hypothetical protein
LPNKVKAMRSVYTIRLPEEYVGMLENIHMELQHTGIEVKDNVLLKTVLLTGIRAINLKITQGINIFDENERDNETDHRPTHP